MTKFIQITHYKGQREQQLRNVPILSPSIFWVKKGHKHLKWQDRWLRFSHKNWLLTPAHYRLTFVNSPDVKDFHSIQMSFLLQPDPKWIDLSEKSEHFYPEWNFDESAEYWWDTLINMPSFLSEEAQAYLVQGFYQYLATQGVLHCLFPQQSKSWKEKVAEYLFLDPSSSHTIDSVCRQFGISKATLTRRLSNENSSFREVLTSVRMNHALSLLQRDQECNQLELAMLCGYQSEARFSQRFQQQFGLSPKQYLRTLR